MADSTRSALGTKKSIIGFANAAAGMSGPPTRITGPSSHSNASCATTAAISPETEPVMFASETTRNFPVFFADCIIPESVYRRTARFLRPGTSEKKDPKVADWEHVCRLTDVVFPFANFPLRRLMGTGDSGEVHYRIEMLAEETITVPAGKFKVRPIVRRWFSQTSFAISDWFSYELGYSLRVKLESFRGFEKKRPRLESSATWELTDYELMD